jgi:hypothetical protein
MAVDMNIMGTSVTPDMIRKSIRQWHQAHQTNGETLARQLLKIPEDQAMPAYRIEKNSWPTLVYHPEFKSHVLEPTPEAQEMMQLTQARYLRKARNPEELRSLLAKGWLLEPPNAMNAAPPSELLDDGFDSDDESAYAAIGVEDAMDAVEPAPIKRGRPRGSGSKEHELAG